MKLREISLFLLALLTGYTAQCQIRYIPPTAHLFSFGIGGGVTQLFGDFYGKPKSPSAWADLNYNVSPYFNVGIEAQHGYLVTGGRDVTRKTDGFYVTNAYTSASANMRLSLGAFLTHASASTFVVIVSGVYGGAGIGIINNDITTSTRGGLDQTGLLYSPIKKSSTATNIPLNAGIDINLPRIFGLTGFMANFNYQYNFCQSDYIDGYDPKVAFNKHNDTYIYTSIGIRYNFGRIR